MERDVIRGGGRISSRITAVLLVIFMFFTFVPREPGFAAEEYGYQGLVGTVEVPGKGTRETNNLKLVEPSNITVEKTTSELGGYFLNRINDTMDGTQRIEFAFCMTAGMNQLWENYDREDGTGKELRFVPRNLEPDADKVGREELRDKLTQVNIYQVSNGETYDGTWLGKKEAVANYQKGNLKVDYDKCKANETNNDRTGKITLYLPEDTLTSGEYILEFGPDICGNEPLKVPLVPIAFQFTVKGDYTFDSAMEEAKALLEKAVPGQEPGNYGAEEIDSLKQALQRAEELGQDTSEEEKEAVRGELVEAIRALENSRVVELSAGTIEGIAEELAVGDSGTASVALTANPNDNGAYLKKEWRIKEGQENGVITIDPDSGEYTANREGAATIQVVSKWNQSVLREQSVTVKGDSGVLAVNLPKGTSLESMVTAAGKSAEEISALRIYTAAGVSLTGEDFTFIRTMKALTELDLSKASCGELPADSSGNGALAGCETICEVTLPENLQTIGAKAFAGCASLRALEIPTAVTSIGKEAFSDCGKLNTLMMRPVSPPECEASAFAGSVIKTVNVPYGCGGEYEADSQWNRFTVSADTQESTLTITVSENPEADTLKEAAESALGTERESNVDTLIIKTSGDKELSASVDVPYLRKNFINASTIDLSDANLPDHKLSGTVFYGRINTSIKKLRLNDNITNIGQNALNGFTNLRDIILPASLEYLSEGTFGDCEKLNSTLVINGETPPIVSGAPFVPGTVKTIIVPPKREAAYRSNAFWRTFKIMPQIGVSLNVKTLVLEVTQSKILTANVTVYSNNDKTVYWSSSNERVATVDRKTGKVTAIKPGTAVIKATTLEGGVSASCTVTVRSMAAPTARGTVSGYNKAKVSWSAVNGAQGYIVYRSTNRNSGYAQVRTLSSSARSYTDIGLKTGTTYYYKVRAYKTAGSTRYLGEYSAVASVKPVLSKAAKVKAKRAGKRKIRVSWKRVSGANGYKVYQSTKKKSGFRCVKTIKKAKTVKYTTKKLKKGKRYYFKVRAFRNAGGKKVYSAYSSRVSCKAR